LLHPEGVFEVRVPDPRIDRSTKTLSGYFDSPEKATDEIAKLDGRGNIYVTLNPINSALLARANNRMVANPRATTSDADVVQRAWFGIDFDPVRPSGVSSTENEHELALTKAAEVKAHLIGLGWPEPISGDSGNGAHLLFTIRLPNDEESTKLIQGVLEALDLTFSDDKVVVDVKTFNPSRIWKVYGSLACKGDHTQDRPHRRSRILRTPAKLEVVREDQLVGVVAWLPKDEPSERPQRTGGATFDIEKWIGEHSLGVSKVKEWKGGRLFELDVCPFDDNHKRTARIVQASNGALSFSCFHLSCASRDWHALRDLVEPGLREKRKGKRSTGPQSPKREDAETIDGAPRDDNVIRIGDHELVEWDDNGIDFIHETVLRSGDVVQNRRNVVLGHLEAIARLQIDDETFYVVKQDRETICRADELIRKLKREGRVVSRSHVEDSVNAILNRPGIREGRGHSAVGVYADESGGLKLCADSHLLYPLYKEQDTVTREISKALEYESKPDDVTAYLDLVTKFRSYEVFPAMGIAAIAPFALLLRGNGILLPHLYHLSPEHGLGKSAVARAFSESLYGRLAVTADSFDSEFRFACTMDSAGVPVCIEEADKLKQEKLASALKASAERDVCDKRGQVDLGMITYRSRSCLFLTGNGLPFSSLSVLTRFLAIRFDDGQAANRHRPAARKEFEGIVKRLRPIGFELTRHALKRWPTREALLKEVEEYCQEIERAFPKNFHDSRRAASYSTVYMGLVIWEDFAREWGTKWTRPTVQEFVDFVVLPIEDSTFETGILPVMKFVRWWAWWRATNIDPKTGDTKGMGVTFMHHSVKGETGSIDGSLVTSEVIEAYNEKAEPGFRISSSIELARQVLSAYCIEAKEIGGEGMRGLVRKFGGVSKRCVFVPDEEAEIVRNDAEVKTADEYLLDAVRDETRPDSAATNTMVVTANCGSKPHMERNDPYYQTTKVLPMPHAQARVCGEDIERENEIEQDPIVEDTLRLVSDLQKMNPTMPNGFALATAKDRMTQRGFTLTSEQISNVRSRLGLPPPESVDKTSGGLDEHGEGEHER